MFRILLNARAAMRQRRKERRQQQRRAARETTRKAPDASATAWPRGLRGLVKRSVRNEFEAFRASVEATEDVVGGVYQRLGEEMRTGDAASSGALIDRMLAASGVDDLFTVREFLSFLESERPDIASFADAGGARHVLLHFPIWGVRYCEKFLSYCIESLLAETNLPACTGENRFVVLVHTDAATRPVIERDARIAELRRHAEVIVESFPNEPLVGRSSHARSKGFTRNWKYMILGGLQRRAIELAQSSDAYLALIPSDVCLAEGTLAHWLALVGEGYDLVTTQVPRTDFDGAQTALDAHRQDGVLSIPARTMVELQIEHLHESNVDRTFFEGNVFCTGRGQMIFPHADGYVMRGYHYHPILSAPDLIADLTAHQTSLLPADEYILSIALAGERHAYRSYLPETADDCGLMELSDHDIEIVRAAALPAHQASVANQVGRFARYVQSHLEAPQQRALLCHRVFYERRDPSRRPAFTPEETTFETVLAEAGVISISEQARRLFRERVLDRQVESGNRDSSDAAA